MTEQTGEPTPPDVHLPDVHLEDVQQELEPLKGMSVWARLRLSYKDMRATTRALIEEEPTEPRLLFFVLLADIIFFLSMGVRTVVSPSAVVEQSLPLPAAMGGMLVGILLLRTTMMYVLAAVTCIISRMLGGQGSFKDTRCGVFWASLVATPVGVLGALVGGLFANLEELFPILQSPIFAWPPLFIGLIAFTFFVSAGVAEAQRFKKISPVFITFSVLTILGMFAVLILNQLVLNELFVKAEIAQ